MKTVFATILTLFVCITSAQNTVGVIGYASEKDYSEGFNLIYPHYQSDAFLFNDCGEIVNHWKGLEGYRNHNICYLTDNGDLIRNLRKDVGVGFIWETNGETLIECRTWNDSLN